MNTKTLLRITKTVQIPMLIFNMFVDAITPGQAAAIYR